MSLGRSTQMLSEMDQAVSNLKFAASLRNCDNIRGSLISNITIQENKQNFFQQNSPNETARSPSKKIFDQGTSMKNREEDLIQSSLSSDGRDAKIVPMYADINNQS